MALFEGFAVNVLSAAAENPKVKELLDSKVDEVYDKIKADLPQYVELFKTELLPVLMPELKGFFKTDVLPAILAVLPDFGEALIKSVFNKVPSLPNADQLGDVAVDFAKNILDKDPDLPIISDYFDLSEILKNVFGGLVARRQASPPQ